MMEYFCHSIARQSGTLFRGIEMETDQATTGDQATILGVPGDTKIAHKKIAHTKIVWIAIWPTKSYDESKAKLRKNADMFMTSETRIKCYDIMAHASDRWPMQADVQHHSRCEELSNP